MSLYRKSIGQHGEELAARYLRNLGFQILEINYRCRLGELDIIAQKDEIIHGVEVKTRSNLLKGAPYEAVNAKKILHMKRTLEYYALTHHLLSHKITLDVLSILLNNEGEGEINYYKNITL